MTVTKIRSPDPEIVSEAEVGFVTGRESENSRAGRACAESSEEEPDPEPPVDIDVLFSRQTMCMRRIQDLEARLEEVHKLIDDIEDAQTDKFQTLREAMRSDVARVTSLTERLTHVLDGTGQAAQIGAAQRCRLICNRTVDNLLPVLLTAAFLLMIFCYLFPHLAAEHLGGLGALFDPVLKLL